MIDSPMARLGAGLIKIRGDQCWRDLTCMDYHYETQPVPSPLSWALHHNFGWVHQLEVQPWAAAPFRRSVVYFVSNFPVQNIRRGF
jgi:hypothetical protein